MLDGRAGGRLLVGGQSLPMGGLETGRAGNDTVLEVAGGGGAHLLQTDTFRIDALPVSGADGDSNGPVTVFLDLSPVRRARFGGPGATSTDLGLRPGSGSVIGKVRLGDLLIVGTAAPQLALFGTLGGLHGAAAASNGTIRLAPQINYTLNGFVIDTAHRSTEQILLPEPAPQSPDPLANFGIAPPEAAA